MNEYDAEEQYLLEILAMLRESYDKAAKPYIEQIAMIRRYKKPEPIFVTVEQAKQMGFDVQQQPKMIDPNIWQDYDCPISGIDIDIHGADIVVIGETFHCAGCWKTHTAGVDVNLQTYVSMGNGELDYRGMPKDAVEKAKWIAEAGKTK